MVMGVVRWYTVALLPEHTAGPHCCFTPRAKLERKGKRTVGILQLLQAPGSTRALFEIGLHSAPADKWARSRWMRACSFNCGLSVPALASIALGIVPTVYISIANS
jgi:hypothetical protein